MKFRRNQPVETREALVKVDGISAGGKYRFQLVVTDDRGRTSRPAQVVVVEVVRGKTPRA